MKHGPVTISSSNHPERQCIVKASDTLAHVVDGIDESCTPYLLVEDADGRLLGIVETAQVIKRLTSTNEVERRRWSQMQVEAALQWKISPASSSLTKSTKQVALPMNCTAVESDGEVVAIVSDSDVFVSWQSISASLKGATVDAVTGLPTRAVFERRLNEEISRAARSNQSIAVLLIDIDYFKQVNDMFGHGVGDAALEAIANLLSEQLRSYDLLTRYGGDEFAAICCGCQPDEIDIPLLRIQEALKANFSEKSVALPPVTLSIGAAVVHQVRASQSIDDLMEMADMCLYSAKEDGRDCAYKIELDENGRGSSKKIGQSNVTAQQEQSEARSV